LHPHKGGFRSARLFLFLNRGILLPLQCNAKFTPHMGIALLQYHTFASPTMKVELAYHPALLGMIPNPPDLNGDGADPNGDGDGPILGSRELPSHRHEKGRLHLAAVLNWWMGRNEFSHSDLSNIADWALDEPGWLISSQISHIRNANVRNAGFRNLEALGDANRAIWSWNVEGREMCWKRFGPPRYNVSEDVLNAATWLHHPENENRPLDFASFCEISVGRLVLDYVRSVSYSPLEAKDINFKLSRFCDAAVAATGLGMREGFERVLSFYPGHREKARVRKLREVILGQEHYTPKELETESRDLAGLVAAVKGLPKGSIAPEDLRFHLANPD
jgi:hypothetical protein